MPIDAVVADANVLLSAVVGKAALRVFTDYHVIVHVASFNIEEVEEYLPQMAGKYRLPADLVALQLRLLPLRIHPVQSYSSALGQALNDLRGRDPEDAHALALARALHLPLWSNDKDLSGRDVERISTAMLLGILESESRASR